MPRLRGVTRGRVWRRVLLVLAMFLIASCTQSASPPKSRGTTGDGPTSTTTHRIPSTPRTIDAVPGRYVSGIGHLAFRYPPALRRTDHPYDDDYGDHEEYVTLDGAANLRFTVRISTLPGTLPSPAECDGSIQPGESQTDESPNRCRYLGINGILWAETEWIDDEPGVSMVMTTYVGAYSYAVYGSADDRAPLDRVFQTLQVDAWKTGCQPHVVPRHPTCENDGQN